MLEAQIYIKKHFKTEKIGGGACRLPFWKVFTPPPPREGVQISLEEGSAWYCLLVAILPVPSQFTLNISWWAINLFVS